MFCDDAVIGFESGGATKDLRQCLIINIYYGFDDNVQSISGTDRWINNASDYDAKRDFFFFYVIVSAIVWTIKQNTMEGFSYIIVYSMTSGSGLIQDWLTNKKQREFRYRTSPGPELIIDSINRKP